MLRELDRLQQIELTEDGRQIVMRTLATGTVGALFKAARIAPSSNIANQPEPLSSGHLRVVLRTASCGRDLLNTMSVPELAI